MRRVTLTLKIAVSWSVLSPRTAASGVESSRSGRVALYLALPFGPREETGCIGTVRLHRFDSCAADLTDAKRETRLLYAVVGRIKIG